MQKVAKFQRVSYAQFLAGAEMCQVPLSEDKLKAAYDRLKLPVRATSGSAGYDFFTPFAFSLATREGITIPTGIRVKIEEGWWLGLLPRSGHGFKYRIQLDNTMGVIDSDYYNADNEGHILIRISNDGLTGRHLDLLEGDSFAQGIFLPYGITTDDCADRQRTGGMGSTDREAKADTPPQPPAQGGGKNSRKGKQSKGGDKQKKAPAQDVPEQEQIEL